jgi:hypothetical protein
VSAEQIIVLVLLVAAFAAGWVANGQRGQADLDGPDGVPGTDDDLVAPVEAPVLEGPLEDEPPTGPAEPPYPEERDAERPLPGVAALRALDRALQAYEHVVDRWIEERDAITPAGRATLGELDRAIARLDAAVTRLEDPRQERFAGSALDALRDAAEALDGFRAGGTLDAATSKRLHELEDEIEEARGALDADLNG